ncbi:13K-protein [Plantago asiatica mosaic virus]|uniref:Movement protein TGBp3 n=1 Tax=Plantago asiatica mosaic potexvirus TaxID=28354 RepID=TGB3_P1AMV|nr:13K triple gene block protein [Plantago asiatica mosaic virus]Q07520.1 RecName: Full=Movement protein TGBp3; AltName: Full=13 kDa protein; AltName: Full=Triple gene block 3 protein; Short=TGBp3 [Plantago asiatica mosaic virus]AAB26350.1 13 kda putative membrane-associated protein [Plantago asiatica mosaic virus]CAA79764.1 13K-protein [Plantago asiatica mosaic virus]
MHYPTEADTSTGPNPSATSAPVRPRHVTPSLSPSSSSSPSPDSFYYFLAAAVILTAALAAALLTPNPGCTIVITGHTTIIQGSCPIPPQLVLAAHPRGLSLEQYLKFTNTLPDGSQHRSHR